MSASHVFRCTKNNSPRVLRPLWNPPLARKQGMEDGMDNPIQDTGTVPATLHPALADSLLDDPFAPPPCPAPAGRRPGRPRSMGQAWRSAYVTIRVMPSEKVRLLAAARRAGHDDTSTWARGLLMAACDGEAPAAMDVQALAEVARLRRDLNSGIGANLNQAMLHANALAKGGEQPDGDTLLHEVRQAREAVEALHADLQRLLRPAGRR